MTLSPAADVQAEPDVRLPTVKRIETEVAKLPLDVFIRPSNGRVRGIDPVRKGKQEELIPGLKNWLGKLVSRQKTEKQPEAKVLPESSSIAERIARDFGSLDAADSA